jgi:hypothetical protein
VQIVLKPRRDRHAGALVMAFYNLGAVFTLLRRVFEHRRRLFGRKIRADNSTKDSRFNALFPELSDAERAQLFLKSSLPGLKR